jgi:DNA polymerase I-like protein with 3'-5' exonuclease and polymerase domains
MSQNGFGFDRALAVQHAARLRDLEADARKRADVAVGRPILATKTGGFSTKDLHRAFFDDLGAPPTRSALTGNPTLGVEVLRNYASAQNESLRALSLAVLEWRRARKVRSTYIEAIRVGDDGRVHPSWLNYGAISGRWACQGPNLMNLPRAENDPCREWGGIRALYMPAAGNVLVAFDAKQLEMRIAAYASGDEAMIAACESRDLHSANAERIFRDFVAAEYLELDAIKKTLTPEQAMRYAILSAFRSLAKSAGFAVCYLAEAETVWVRITSTKEGAHVRLGEVKAMLRGLRKSFHAYFAWQDRRYYDVVRTGYVESPILGRRRWLGHDPSPTECANFPIQGGAADLMNERLPMIVDALRTRSPRTRIVAQVHDSGVFDVPRSDVRIVKETCHEFFEAPMTIESSGTRLVARFPIDMKEGERWA